MSVTLNASSVPVPTGPSAQYLLANAYVPQGNCPQSKRGPISDPASFTAWLMDGHTRTDVGTTFSPGFGIINGLGLTINSGLVINVAAGQAGIYGVAEVAAQTVTLPDNTARVFVWLKSDYDATTGGANSIALTTSTTPPSTTGASGQCVLLGSFSTSAGVSTGPDTSGVVYLSKCGLPYRETADAEMPGDTPTAGFQFITRCKGGTFLWDGTGYLKLANAGTYTASGNATLTTEQTRVRTITTSGAGGYTLTVSKELREWIVQNVSAGSLTISDGTNSVVVAAGKTALVGCNSSKVFRITADV